MLTPLFVICVCSLPLVYALLIWKGHIRVRASVNLLNIYKI
jgi:hypothetical protein